MMASISATHVSKKGKRLSHCISSYVDALRLAPLTILFKSAFFILKLINKYAAFSSLGPGDGERFLRKVLAAASPSDESAELSPS
jgi:hypothetical protein